MEGMRALPGWLLLALLACASACGGRSNLASTSGSGGSGGGSTAGSDGGSTTSSIASTTGSTGGGGAATCQGSGTSSLDGVSIVFPPQRCTFSVAEAAAGITIAYEVVVTNGGFFISPEPLDFGHCGTPGPSGLIPLASLTGGGQRYCLCDVGECMPRDVTVPIPDGSYPASFKWDGKNWSGPSDTSNPEGSPFPPGQYTLTVSANGAVDTPGPLVPFVITGTFPIELTP
jgi:hypothetical protein